MDPGVRLMKMSTEKKIVAGLVLALAVVIAKGSIAYQSSLNLIETNRSTTRTYSILTELESIFSTLQDAEAGQRGYLITGDGGYLDSYNATATLISGQIAHIKELT